MPLYEYQCKKCGARTEKIRKFSDPPLKRCEKCGGELDHLISSAAIQFKGSGWYVTDYARKSAPAESGDSAAKSDAKKQPEPSKPAPAATTKSKGD